MTGSGYEEYAFSADLYDDVAAYTLRHVFRFEAEHMLARTGFEVEHVYADYGRNPCGSRYPGELVFIAWARP